VIPLSPTYITIITFSHWTPTALASVRPGNADLSPFLKAEYMALGKIELGKSNITIGFRVEALECSL